MKQKNKLSNLIWLFIVSLLLTACETEKVKQINFVEQQNFFFQSIELVETAGLALQKPGLSANDIEAAMMMIDEGLSKANHVEQDFLGKLDVRLPKLYTSIFIKGVESYRLGFEASDQDAQLRGLSLLNEWAKFWLKEKKTIQTKLIEENL